LTRETQEELTRIGCYAGRISGNLNVATRDALRIYRQRIGAAPEPAAITPEQLLDLRERPAPTCPPTNVAPAPGKQAPALVRRPQRTEPVQRAQQPQRERAAESKPARAAAPAAAAPAATTPRRVTPGLGLGF
jgi:hypothetical protein